MIALWSSHFFMNERMLNQYLMLMGSVFNELRRLGKWKGDNPLRFIDLHLKS